MLRRQQAQTQFDHVRVGGAKLETVLSFVYLGSNFDEGGGCVQGANILLLHPRTQVTCSCAWLLRCCDPLGRSAPPWSPSHWQSRGLASGHCQ